MGQVESTYHWYAIRVKSRAEKKVNLLLAEKGIESYVPLQRRLRKWSDRKKWVDWPLISGYVFVHISRKEYELVLSTYNVVCYVYFEGKAAVIRDKDIHFLKRMLGQSELELEVSIENFRQGQMVEVIAGPLCGVVGELIEFKGRNKVALRIPPLGYTVLVETPEKTLIPFGSEIQLS
jgi:transcription antitermination factor NusG